MWVAPKNRNSGKRKKQRHGLSGNPQRRAEQLEKDRPERPARQGQQGLDLLPGSQADSLRDLAYLLAGGAEEAPWWRGSHERVLQKARALDWPSRALDIEERTCDLVGGQFYDNLQAHDRGHHQAQWLRSLVERAGAALHKAITDGGDWQPLWTLLYGVALTTPESAAEGEQESALREEFPDVKDPHAVAVGELAKASILLSERSVVASPGFPDSAARLVGVPLVARDAYGSRFLVAAPFGYEADAPDHWYAWDVDACWVVSVVGAGMFRSADEALAEWRGAVGTVADSELSPDAPGLVAGLLGPCLQTGVLAYMLHGNEPRELIRELYRMRRRARALGGAAFGAADGTPANWDIGGDKATGDVDQFGRPTGAHKAFLAWYRTRHPGAPKGITATAETIIGEWGPGHHLDERSFYACSPFRVAMTAHMIGNDYDPAHASLAIRLPSRPPALRPTRSTSRTLRNCPTPRTPRRSATRNACSTSGVREPTRQRSPYQGRRPPESVMTA
jgi:hypothetical protein